MNNRAAIALASVLVISVAVLVGHVCINKIGAGLSAGKNEDGGNSSIVPPQPFGASLQNLPMWGEETWDTDELHIRLAAIVGSQQQENWDNLPPPQFMPPHPRLLENGVQPWGTVDVPAPHHSTVVGPQEVLVILIDFPDQEGVQTQAHYESLLFGATNSLSDYYDEVSYSQLNVQGSIAGSGWYRSAHNMTYWGDETEPISNLAMEAIQWADTEVNFSTYDTDNDGLLEPLELHIVIIHAGQDQAATGDEHDILSHHDFIPIADTVDGIRVSGTDSAGYMMLAENSPLGTFAHEFGHSLGLPDLFDTTYNSRGVGDWDLMGYGGWLGGGTARDGSSPAHLGAWAKVFLGWVTPTQITPDESPAHGVQINQAETPGATIIQLLDNPDGTDDWDTDGNGDGEYFLVESRQLVGYDNALPGAGLLIWHIDESRGNNDNVNHKLVDLEEADGLNELDNKSNYGDENDPYVSSTAGFTPTTNPNSNLYNGTVSGVSVTNISPAAQPMTADFQLPNFAIGVSPTSASVTPGEFTSATVTVAPIGGEFSNAVRLSLSGAPSGVSLFTTLGTPLFNSTLSVSSSTPTGYYTIKITGTEEGGELTRTCTYSLRVGDFSVSVSPSSGSINVGSSTSATVTVAPIGAFHDSVWLFIDNSPPGVILPPTMGTPPFTSTLYVDNTVDNTTPAGSYTITIVGTEEEGVTHTCTYTLTVKDFAVGVSPSSGSINVGSSTSATVTVTSLYGFNNSVNLSLSDAPSGVSLSTSGTPTFTSTLSVDNTTPAGSYTIKITGSGGGLTRTCTYSLTVENFAVSVNPSSGSINVGSSTSATVTVAPIGGGFSSAVSLSLSGAPPGVSLSTTSGTPTFTSTLYVDNTTPAGSYTITITGTSGSLTRTCTYSLTVKDFAVGVSPSSGSINVGSSTSATVTVAPIGGGFSSAVSLSLSGAPSGVGLSTTLGTPLFNSTLSVSSSTPAGSYTITITGSGGGLTRSCTYTLTVTDFNVSVSPTSGSVNEGSSTSATVTVTSLYGFNNSVNLSLSGAPSGVSLSTTSGTPTFTSTLSVSSSTPAGSYTITITGTSGSLTRTCTYTLTVGDFAVGVSPSSGSINVGSSTSATVTVAPIGGGFSSAVSLSLSGAPSGVGLSTTLGTPLFNSTLSVSSSTPAGSYTITITGSGGGLTRSCTYSLTVTDFSVSVSPTSGSINAGSSTSATVTITSINGFSSTVSLSASGLPSTKICGSTSFTTLYCGSTSFTNYYRTCGSTSFTDYYSKCGSTSFTDYYKTCGSTSFTNPYGYYWQCTRCGAYYPPTPKPSSCTASVFSYRKCNSCGATYSSKVSSCTRQLFGYRRCNACNAIYPSKVSSCTAQLFRYRECNACGARYYSYVSSCTKVTGYRCNSCETTYSSKPSSCTAQVPTGASISFSPSSGTPSFSSTMTISTSSTPAGTYTITITGTSGSLTRTCTYTLTVT